MMLGDVELKLVEDFTDAAACLEWLDHTGALGTQRIGFDTETTGLSVETDRVRLVQFGDALTGWAIPIDRWWGLVAEIIARWSKTGRRFVAHNARYDVAMLRNHDLHIPTHLVDDTMMLAHIANPTVSVGLKQQSGMHIDPRAAAMQAQLSEVMHSGGYTWATIPITPTGPCAVYWIYGALDPVLTVRLWEHHAPTVLKEAPRAYDLEVATGWLADQMERKGVLVDRDYTQTQQAVFSQRFDALTQRGFDEFGVDLGSASQITDVLLRDKVDLWKRTDGGAWSLDKFALEGIGHPLVTLLQERKRIEKLGSTYLRRFLEYSEYDGRLHPNINTLGFNEESSSAFGVITSRMSMSKPNLQQLPRVEDADPLSIVVRNCIVAKPGHTLVMFDFDQIELRIMAHLSKDPGLAAAFASDGDFFTELTRTIYHDPGIVKKDARRNLIKSYTYATNYGAGNDRLASTAKRPLSEIEKVDADFRRTYAGVPEFQREIQREAYDRLQAEGSAYVYSPLTGRKFIADNRDKLYTLVNYKIQGMAAEIMKMKLLELDAAGLGDYLELVVHDEAIAEVPDDEVPDVIETMNGVMNDKDLLSIPLTAGGATGKRWAEKQDV
jgi:DNA polymerase I